MIKGYNAEAPPRSLAPVMEAGNTGGNNVSRSFEALGDLSNQLGRSPLAPNVDPDLGQATSAGIQNVGRGLEDLSNVIHTVKVQEQKFQNYIDVQDAKTAMAMHLGDFRKHIADPSSNPRDWEGSWSSGFQRFRDGYFEGKEIGDAAKAEIRRDMESFGVNNSVRVGVDAVNATTGKAREALKAEIMLAVESENVEQLKSITEWGSNEGLIGVDDSTRAYLSGMEQIKTKRNGRLDNQKKTAIYYGEAQSARAFVEAKDIAPDEKELELAELDMVHARKMRFDKFEDTMDGQSPEEAILLLESEEFAGVRPSDREQMASAAYTEMNSDRAAILSALKQSIDFQGITDISQIKNEDNFKYLTEMQQTEVARYISKSRLNDSADFSTLLRSVRSYDAKQDPRGFEKLEFETKIALGFDGGRAEELAKVLSERSDPSAEPLSASARVFNDRMDNFQSKVNAGLLGQYKVKYGDIEEIEVDGQEVLAVRDEYGDVESGGFALPFTGRRIKFGEKQYRVIQLSESDKDEWDKGKDSDKEDKQYDDLLGKDQAHARRIAIEADVESQWNVGEFKGSADMDKILNGELDKYNVSIARMEMMKDRGEGSSLHKDAESLIKATSE